MALFVPDVEFTIALVFIEYLRNCFPNVRNRVSFHMIYPGGYLKWHKVRLKAFSRIH